MIKKLITIVLAVALLCTAFVLPSYAEEEASLKDMLLFSVDYRTGDAKDRVTGSEPTFPQVPSIKDENGQDAYVTEMVYVDDATLGSKVAHFNGTYSVGYPIDHSKLGSNFTVEAYVMLGQGQSRWGMICGTTWMQGQIAVNGFSLCTANMPLDGIKSDKFDTPDTDRNKSNYVGHPRKYLYSWNIGNGAEGCINYGFPGTGKAAEALAAKGKWIHMVYTHDGANEQLYVDGVKVVDQEARIPEITHDTSNEMAELFRIGGYNWANNWDLDDGYVAYVNVYEVALSGEDEAKELYDNRGTSVDGVPSKPLPSDDPSDPADPEATKAPATAKPTEAPKQDNTQTFDLGLVSLAAVALSSAVVVKKKRK